MKYPRTYHLPVSLGRTRDDLSLTSIEQFLKVPIVITEKMDGENTSMSCDRIWARSLDSKDHVSRHYVKNLWNTVRYNIPKDYRICGENLHYTKSIHYFNLTSYFQVFSAWYKDTCLSWKDTTDLCSVLGLPTVSVKYEGVFQNKKNFYDTFVTHIPSHGEGLVIRIADSFSYEDFSTYVGKYVRKNHVQTSKHWMHLKLEKNELKG